MVKECLVFLDLDASDMDDFLNQAATTIFKTKLIGDRDEFLSALIQREKEITTGVGKGVAFPHATGAFIKDPFIALFRLNEAIDYKSIDGRPVDLFFVIGTPIGAEEIHLKILSRLAQNFAETDFREELRIGDSSKLIRGVLRNIFKPMVIVVHNDDDVKEELLKMYSPKVNFFFYKDGSRVEPFEIHISDLTIAVNQETNNRLITEHFTFDQTVKKINKLLENRLIWEDEESE